MKDNDEFYIEDDLLEWGKSILASEASTEEKLKDIIHAVRKCRRIWLHGGSQDDQRIVSVLSKRFSGTSNDGVQLGDEYYRFDMSMSRLDSNDILHFQFEETPAWKNDTGRPLVNIRDFIRDSNITEESGTVYL